MTTLAVRESQALSITGDSYGRIIDLFLSSLDKFESTKILYRKTLRLFFEWVGQKGYNLETLEAKELLEYKSDLLTRGMSTLSVSSYITSLRRFYEWAEANKVYPNIAKAVHSPKRVMKFQKEHLEAEQAGALLRFAREGLVADRLEDARHKAELAGKGWSGEKLKRMEKQYERQGLRDYAIVSLLLRTGLRCVEVVRADCGDITYKGGQRVLMVQGKGREGKDSFVVLTDKAYAPISDYLKSRPGHQDKEPLFTSLSNANAGGRLTTREISFIAKDSLRRYGIDSRSYTAHSFRHTAAVNILQATNWNIEIVQRALRHTNPATTQIYTETIKERERLSNSGERYLDSLY